MPHSIRATQVSSLPVESVGNSATLPVCNSLNLPVSTGATHYSPVASCLTKALVTEKLEKSILVLLFVLLKMFSRSVKSDIIAASKLQPIVYKLALASCFNHNYTLPKATVSFSSRDTDWPDHIPTSCRGFDWNLELDL